MMIMVWGRHAGQPLEPTQEISNLYDTLYNSAQRHPDKIAVVDRGRSLTYRELLVHTDNAAGFLAHQLGLVAGERAALLLGNSVDFCVYFYAVLKLGCTAVTLNTKLQTGELQNIVGRTKPAALILGGEWWEKASPLLHTAGLRHTVITDTDDTLRQKLQSRLERSCILMNALELPTQQPAPRHPGGEATALILFTSGSTGDPKGVQLSHRNLISSACSYQESLGLDCDEVTVLSVPVFHVTGLICVMALFIYIAGKIIFLPRFDAAETLRAIQRHQATHFHAVSAVFILLRTALEEEHYDLASLRMAVCGGGPVSPQTIRAMKQHIPQLDFRPAYGLTETAGAGVVFPCDYFQAGKQGAAGLPAFCCHITIRDEEGTVLPTGQPGEVCIQGQAVTRGYLGQEDFPQGLLRTGDIGCMDEDGYLYILDRIKDLINRGGEKVYSPEVEEQLCQIPGVNRAAVFALPHPVYGEVPAAALVKDAAAALDEEAIQNWLRGKIAAYKIPTKVYFLDKLPATSTGKTAKAKLRNMFSSQDEPQPFAVLSEHAR